VFSQQQGNSISSSGGIGASPSGVGWSYGGTRASANCYTCNETCKKPSGIDDGCCCCRSSSSLRHDCFALALDSPGLLLLSWLLLLLLLLMSFASLSARVDFKGAFRNHYRFASKLLQAIKSLRFGLAFVVF
jgi:hypothetical protein